MNPKANGIAAAMGVAVVSVTLALPASAQSNVPADEWRRASDVGYGAPFGGSRAHYLCDSQSAPAARADCLARMSSESVTEGGYATHGDRNRMSGRRAAAGDGQSWWSRLRSRFGGGSASVGAGVAGEASGESRLARASDFGYGAPFGSSRAHYLCDGQSAPDARVDCLVRLSSESVTEGGSPTAHGIGVSR